ncbi:MAG: 50S ribosomal protein L35 [candidate division BRC1 bacterium ADurb.BinA364]|nr:MAG: 50S ribosomal protein L35 [candidate division BRC1 bacterium ADurb.BinA364]
MPKIKTRSGVKDRIKITGTGKIRRHRAGMSHLLGKKKSKRIRHNRQECELHTANLTQILRLMGK